MAARRYVFQARARRSTSDGTVPSQTQTGTAGQAPEILAVKLQRTMKEKPAYTVAEIAELTGFSRQTITRMFEREKGVLILERPETLHKRGFRSIRVPRAVYERVIRKMSV